MSNFTAPPQQIPVSYDVESLAGLEAFAAERRRKFAGQAQGVVRLTGFCLLVRRDVRSERPAVQCRDATAGLRRLPPAGALLLGPAASGTIARRQGLPDAAADACHLLRGLTAVSRDSYHLLFELRERAHGLLFTDQLAMHILELPKFTKSAAELATPLDRWLYFLRHGENLDTDALPGTLDVPEIHGAQ